MNMNIDDCKSYATEANLMKAIEKLGFASHRFLVVCTRNGRFTAIFPVSNLSGGGYMGLYAQHGFMTLG